jgi:hypothetical protein
MRGPLRRRWVVALAALASVAAAASAYAATTGPAAPAGAETLRFDIAEDPTRFVFSPTPVDGEGMPAYGNSFVTQGYIYPEGTLNGSDGVLPDGRPAFPDEVLGEWTCWGTHVGKGARTETGPWVVTQQLFQLGKRVGETTLVTAGYETPESAPIARSISGGTGRFAHASGEQVQRFLGFGATNGVKLRVTLRVRR